MRSRWGNRLGRYALTTVVVAATSPALAEDARRAWLNLRDAAAVERAREGAARRLEGAECRRIFSYFHDTRGRTIEKNLEERAMSPAEYVRILSFVDGFGERLCHSSKVTLVSSPHVPRVVVCPAFAGLQWSCPSMAEILVIHEVLHTLGLGENPPASAEITRRVEERCR